jgi:hypothetical protein
MNLTAFLPAAVLAGERLLTSEEWGDLADEHLDINDVSPFVEIIPYLSAEDQALFRDTFNMLERVKS